MTVDTWEKLMTGISETVNTNNSVWPPRYLMSAHKIFSTFLTLWPVREYSLRPGPKYNLKLSFSGCQGTRFGIWKIMQNNYLRVTTKLQEEHIFVWSRQDEFIGSVNLEEAASYQEIRWHATLANEELNPSDPFSCKHITLPSPYMLHVTCHTC